MEKEINCSKCKVKLVRTGFGGYENSLTVDLHGGYVEFVDTIVFSNEQMTNYPLSHRLCHQCAHSLLNWLEVPMKNIEGWHPRSEGDDFCEGYQFP